eukprot:sb/3469066/
MIDHKCWRTYEMRMLPCVDLASSSLVYRTEVSYTAHPRVRFPNTVFFSVATQPTPLQPQFLLDSIPSNLHSGCTLNTNDTGCEWNDITQKVKIYYTVDFTTPVWSPAERRRKGEIQKGQVLRFWDCNSAVVQSGRVLSHSSPFILSTREKGEIICPRSVRGSPYGRANMRGARHEVEDADGGFNFLGLAVFAAVVVVLVASIGLFLTIRAKKNRTKREQHLTPALVFSNDVFADIDIDNN